MNSTKQSTRAFAEPREAPVSADRTERDSGLSAIRSTVLGRASAIDGRVRERLAAKLGKHADRLASVTVRFEDASESRAVLAVVSRAKAVLVGLPSVTVEARAETDRSALAALERSLARAVRRALGRASRPTRADRRTASLAEPPADVSPDPGSFIGRRVGRAARNLAAALERPEKLRRDSPVDTAAPGVSATDRKAGGRSTARRNSKARAPRATATLEDSRKPRPSRKSTRRSANRAKSATNLQKREVAAARSPKARAVKARR